MIYQHQYFDNKVHVSELFTTSLKTTFFYLQQLLFTWLAFWNQTCWLLNMLMGVTTFGNTKNSRKDMNKYCLC